MQPNNHYSEHGNGAVYSFDTCVAKTRQMQPVVSTSTD